MKRFVLLVLAAMLMASCLIVVHAEEATPIQSVSVAQNDPYFKGQIRQVIPRNNSIYSSDTYYTRTSECGAFLREGMKQRYEAIAVNYETYNFDESNAEQAAAEIGAEMVAYACEHTGNPKEGDYLSWQYAYVLYLDGYVQGSKYYLTFIFVGGYSTTAEEEAQVDVAVAQLLPKLGGESDYDKVKAVYDWVTANVTCVPMTEVSPVHDFSAYGALVNKSANSLGISSLIYRLLLELGIDNRIMYGTYNGAEQFWNIVHLQREYHNLDAALDCGNTEYQYFLRCDANFGHTRDPYYDLIFGDYPMAPEDYDPAVVKIVASGYYGMEENVDEVYWKFTADNVLTIYGTGRMADTRTTANYWYDWKDQITRIVVEEGITYIGNRAFNYHEAVTSLVLPQSLVSTGFEAFAYCTSLTEITLPNGLKEIGSSCFNDCKNLQKVTLPDGLEIINGYAFSRCKNLNEINLPDSLTELGECAFSFCTSLEYIRIPDSIRVLKYHLLSDCSNLKEVEFSDKLEQIGAYSFSNTGIQSIDIPNSVTSIGNHAFGGSDLTEVVIPDSVTEFGSSVFRECNKLVKAKLPDSLTHIHPDVFYDCYVLEEVILPSNLVEIPTNAFYNCHMLECLTLPASITSIGTDAFFRCKSPFELTFTGNPPVFDERAFRDLTCTAYYPSANTNWTEEVMQDYMGTVTWIPYYDTSGIPGDLNADGTVDDGDVALLLWYTLFPDTYQIEGNADFNADGTVDDADVAYLLWHTLFPDSYPLN